MLPKKYRFSPRKIHDFFTRAQSIKMRCGKWFILSSALPIESHESAIAFAVVIPSTSHLRSVQRHAVTRKIHEILFSLLLGDVAVWSPGATRVKLNCAFLFWGNPTRLLSSKQYQNEVRGEMLRALQNIQE